MPWHYRSHRIHSLRVGLRCLLTGWISNNATTFPCRPAFRPNCRRPHVVFLFVVLLMGVRNFRNGVIGEFQLDPELPNEGSSV